MTAYAKQCSPLFARARLGREDAEDEHRRALRLPSWWLPHSLPRASVCAAYFLDKDSRFEMKRRAPQGDPTEITRFHTALQRKLELQSSLPTRDLLTEIPSGDAQAVRLHEAPNGRVDEDTQKLLNARQEEERRRMAEEQKH